MVKVKHISGIHYIKETAYVPAWNANLKTALHGLGHCKAELCIKLILLVFINRYPLIHDVPVNFFF